MHQKPDTAEFDAASPAAARLLVVGLLLLIAIPGLAQTLAAPSAESARFRGLLGAHPTHESLAQFEKDLATSSRLGTALRRRYREFTLRAFGLGSHDVIVGNDGSFFFRPDLELVVPSRFPNVKRAAQHQSVGVISDFAAQLKARGIALVVLPAPVASMIHPERVWAGHPVGSVVEVPDYEGWLSALRAKGVDVADTMPGFRAARARRESLFARRNTHWLPAGIAIAADVIWEFCLRILLYGWTPEPLPPP